MKGAIEIGTGGLRHLNKIVRDLSPHKTVVITDSRVHDLWLDDVLERIDAEALVIPEGEDNKSLDHVKTIWSELLEMDFTRKSLIIALGGGMITDISAFISSTFKRGTKLGLIPTTLLAQVDAAIGGKTGINFNGKNMIGTFYEPDFVLIDPVFIGTLPEEEIKNGFGEILKYALLTEDVYDLLQGNIESIDVDLIKSCVKYKIDIVQKDLREKGLRRVLNLGHTVGHGIEKLSEYEVKHGEAVSKGLMVNSLIAEDLYGFDPYITMDLLERYGLPYQHDLSPEAILESARDDKKNWFDETIMVLPKKVGEVEIKEVSDELILRCLKETKRSNEHG
ncbi:MAG: 3-dehydroquinate synthase [Candidatus Natronoplasma sp.]